VDDADGDAVVVAATGGNDCFSLLLLRLRGCDLDAGWMILLMTELLMSGECEESGS
jgi:hypothetical protein